MVCAKVENGQVQYPYLAEPDIQNGIFPVTHIKPSTFNDSTEVWLDPSFEIRESEVVVTLTKRPKTQQEITG